MDNRLSEVDSLQHLKSTIDIMVPQSRNGFPVPQAWTADVHCLPPSNMKLVRFLSIVSANLRVHFRDFLIWTIFFRQPGRAFPSSSFPTLQRKFLNDPSVLVLVIKEKHFFHHRAVSHKISERVPLLLLLLKQAIRSPSFFDKMEMKNYQLK